jgi:tripartite-type tricarboxylate transporter receptor subunit TctC
VTDYNMWAVKPDSKVQTVKDVIDEAKRRPARSRSMEADTVPTITSLCSALAPTMEPVPDGALPRHAEGKTQVLAAT